MTISNLPTTIRTQAHVEQLWRDTMEPLGFGSRTLWLTLLDDGTPTGVMVEVADLPPSPRGADLDALTRCFAQLPHLGPGTRIAMLLARPGGGGPTAKDRRWAQALSSAAKLAERAIAPIHLATDLDIVPLPPR